MFQQVKTKHHQTLSADSVVSVLSVDSSFSKYEEGSTKKTDSTMLGMIIRRSQVSQILKMFITAAGNSTYKKIYKWIKLIFRGLFHFLSMFYPLLF